MRPPGACVVFTAVLALAYAGPLCAQQEEWEGKTLSTDPVGEGFIHEPKAKNLQLTGLRKGEPMTREKKDIAIKELFKTGKFQDVQILVKPDPDDKANKVVVTIAVVEY